jgi:hypothetical protein
MWYPAMLVSKTNFASVAHFYYNGFDIWTSNKLATAGHKAFQYSFNLSFFSLLIVINAWNQGLLQDINWTTSEQVKAGTG